MLLALPAFSLSLISCPRVVIESPRARCQAAQRWPVRWRLSLLLHPQSLAPLCPCVTCLLACPDSCTVYLLRLSSCPRVGVLMHAKAGGPGQRECIILSRPGSAWLPRYVSEPAGQGLNPSLPSWPSPFPNTSGPGGCRKVTRPSHFPW